MSTEITQSRDAKSLKPGKRWGNESAAVFWEAFHSSTIRQSGRFETLRLRVKIRGMFRSLFRRHERQWKDHRYVYAVISRRSRGISVGINLNPGKGCNFDCIYCQVNRKILPEEHKVDLDRLSGELDGILEAEKGGSLYRDAPFSLLAPGERGVRDIAFSGDGEPTAFHNFEMAVRIAAQARCRFKLDSAKLIVLTNAAYLDKPAVGEALAVLDENNGEIWAKLDAGTEAYFRRVNRPDVSLDRILDNILSASRLRPLVIQSLWFRISGEVPPGAEIEAYCENLNRLLANGGMLKTVQLYTIARDPAEPSASPLANDELDQIAFAVQSRIPVPVETFYGIS
jgi:wyosine [tRNA(Phe)-imidazoG37] synthetase (radical SAM superfamily)